MRIDGQPPNRVARAKSVLSWISYAKRQLTATELCTALAVELGSSELDGDNILDVEDLVSVCAGLVTVDEESNVIRLVHYTTQDYLEGIRERWYPAAQLEIASTCLTYLCFDEFRSGSCQSDTEIKAKFKHNSFLEYSARYWGEHAAPVEEDVCELAMRLLNDSSLIACTSQMERNHWIGINRWSQRFPKQVTMLHVAASHGLVHLCRAILFSKIQDRKALVNAKDSYSRTPLALAARFGHDAVVEVLLEQDDIDVNYKSDDQTPLLVAAYRGHEMIVKMLLGRKDIEVDSTDENGYTALLYAAEKGHETIVKMLLDNNADINIQGRDFGNSLRAVSYQGYTQLLELLLSHVSTMPFKDRYGRTLLWWAAAGGHIATVEHLVTHHSFDPRVPNIFGQTPMWIAARKGHSSVSGFLSRLTGETSTEQRALSEENKRGNARPTCKVCTLDINLYEGFCMCRKGCYDTKMICLDCKEKGAFCKIAGHFLIKLKARKL